MLNALVDYLLLLAAARVAGEELHRLRFALGAALGGLYAVAIFLPGWGFLAQPPCRVAAAAAMALVAYGGCPRLLRQGLIFAALSCALAGGVLAVGLMGGRALTLGGGVFYSALDFKTVLLSAAVCYGGLTLLFRGLGRHLGPRGELQPVRLSLEGRTVELVALVDTGNTLTDPVSGRRVMVAQGEALSPLFPPDTLEMWMLRDPTGAMEELGKGPTAGRWQLLPYRAVGVERGMLLAVRLDGAKIGGREVVRPLVALSPTPVSDTGSYRVLVGSVE